MSLLTGTRRALLGSGGLRYLLRATFDAQDQAYANGQVLDTTAEGIQDGQLTVVEVDGTLAIVSDKCAFTAQSSPVYGDLGLYSQAIAKALGRGFFLTFNHDDNHAYCGWQNAQALGYTNADYGLLHRNSNRLTAVLQGSLKSVVASYAVSTDYQMVFVLGGYDSNAVKWYQGQTAADYLYGASVYIKGGAFAIWTQLWSFNTLNTATLYAAFDNYNCTGTIEFPSGVPDVDLSAVLQPTCLSTFTGANGTGLDTITPEVGGAWTEHSGAWTISSNKATADGAVRMATVDAGIADGLIDVTHNIGASNASLGGLLARFTDTLNHWVLHPRSDNDTLYLKEIEAGGATVRASTGVTVDASTDYDLRLICDAQQIDGFMDQANKISYGSASFQETATEHGMESTHGGDTFDNYHVAPRTSSVYDTTLDAA